MTRILCRFLAWLLLPLLSWLDRGQEWPDPYADDPDPHGYDGTFGHD